MCPRCHASLSEAIQGPALRLDARCGSCGQAARLPEGIVDQVVYCCLLCGGVLVPDEMGIPLETRVVPAAEPFPNVASPSPELAAPPGLRRRAVSLVQSPVVIAPSSPPVNGSNGIAAAFGANGTAHPEEPPPPAPFVAAPAISTPAIEPPEPPPPEAPPPPKRTQTQPEFAAPEVPPAPAPKRARTQPEFPSAATQPASPLFESPQAPGSGRAVPLVVGGLLAVVLVSALGWLWTHRGGTTQPPPPLVVAQPPAPPPEPPPAPTPKEATPEPEAAPPTSAKEPEPAPAEVATAPTELPKEGTPRKEHPKAETKNGRAEAAKLQRTGYSQLARGDVEGALGSFKRSIALNPVAPLAYRGLGAAYSAKGNTREAAKAYRRYLSLNPRAQDAAEVRALVQQLQ
ncbi:MAG TPA: tetratricopeptide repeat protein [Myxococcaceae bacterium]|nr:tetratricopeptide repeat protein [Myxococcaceae bacterium]